MTLKQKEHVGVAVDDLAAATEFFLALGLELEGEVSVEGRWVDSVVGLEGVRADIVMTRTPDGHGRIALAKFRSPLGRGGDPRTPANARSIHNVTFAVQGIYVVLDRLRAPAPPPPRTIDEIREEMRRWERRPPGGPSDAAPLPRELRVLQLLVDGRTTGGDRRGAVYRGTHGEIPPQGDLE
jgi:hypothetical protein